MASSCGTVTSFFPHNRALHPEGFLHSRGVAGSGFPPLPNIPHCCLPQESGPYLSSNVAGQPLSPAIRLRLGGPLPHQLTDRTRVSPLPDRSFYLSAYGVLADVSISCPPVQDKSSRVTHPSATMNVLKQALLHSPFDLHVLSAPPAFVLSQDQTLRLILSLFLTRRLRCAACAALSDSFFLKGPGVSSGLACAFAFRNTFSSSFPFPFLSWFRANHKGVAFSSGALCSIAHNITTSTNTER